jgi:hypothetical protein
MIGGAWTKLRAKLTSSMRRRLATGLVLAMAMLSIPRPAQAQFGIDLALIIAGLKQINSLLTQVAAPLNAIQKIETEYTQFQRDVIYPIGAINQLKNAVFMFRNEMKAMNGLMSMQYNSAQLPVTQQLEQLLLSGDPNAVKQVGAVYQQVYGMLPADNQAPQFIRYSIDISDAQAQDAMKRAIELDALAQREMEVSEQLQDQIRTATPGTAPMIEAVAAAWVVRANAYSQSAMSQLMRLRSSSIANQSAISKWATTNTNSLTNAIGKITSRGNQ